ncbi:MAG TPA: HAMP domain-containing sensor histidine kinase [Micromonosporaceae bacterium]
MAGVCLVIGVATTVVMHRNLIRQYDAQLTAASERSLRAGDRLPPRAGGGPAFLLAPGQAAGTLGARLVNGAVVQAAVLDRYGEPAALDPDELTALAKVPSDGRPHSVELGPLGDYRAIATRTRTGDVLVTGLPLSYVNRSVWGLVLTEVAVTAAGLLLAAIAGTAIIRLTLRPLRRIATTAARVAELPLAKGAVDLSVRVPDGDTDPRTEVGQVGSALNRMLGHIGDALAARHASETRVRQFVADASHELRTPLSSIRGYAELARRSNEQVPADIAHALARVESESARMTTLVDDLLLLARLDSGRPLGREEVDLSRLVVDAVSDARAASPDHRWQLRLPDGAVTVPGDTARLHQVLANLLANARVHTPPGTTVTTGLAVEDGCALLTVTDQGPGVPQALQPEVFERFARGDTSRSRAAGSTGLGLAIVAAVTHAHDGQVELSSRPGQTSFVVRLPGARQADTEATCE